MSRSWITAPSPRPRFLSAIALMILAALAPAVALLWLATGTTGGTDPPAGTDVNITGVDGEALRLARGEEHEGSFAP